MPQSSNDNVYLFSASFLFQQVKMSAPDILLRFNNIDGDKIVGDDIEGTLVGSATLEPGDLNWKMVYKYF